MRPLSAFQAALLTSPSGYSTHPRVWVRDGLGTWLNLNVLFGADWVLGVRINEKLDAPVAEAEVSLARNGPGGGRLSLSPLVVESLANTLRGSFSPLLAEAAYFRVELGLAAPGQVPREEDFFEVFRGRIDEVDAGPEELKVVGRDLGGLLQDTLIEVEREYGDDTVGVPVQSIIQSLCNDNGMASFGLYVPVDPLSQRGKYRQKVEPILDAVRTLAQRIGWDCRMKWRASAGSYALTLYAPDRLQTVEEWAYGPDEYQDLDSVTRQLVDIRTDVEVVYSDRNDLDDSGVPKRKRVTASNPTARAQVGRRWMQVAEEDTSNINTQAEAQRLADAAVADLSVSPLTVSLTVDPHPGMELGDVVRLEPDGVRLDTAHWLAVQELEHECATDGTARMKLVLRGQPSTSVREWLERDARPGIAPSAPFTGPAAPQQLKTTPTVNGFTVAWTPAPSGPKWDEYELHVSREAGFTPSSATFRTRGKATSFHVPDLLPGVTYFCRVMGRDAKGNVGAPSEAVAVTTAYVTPATLLPGVAFGDSPPNPDFEAWSTQSSPPDAWTMGQGLWGGHAQVTEDAFTGRRAVRLLANGTRLDSQAMIARPGDRYSVDALASASASGPVLTVQLCWYDGAFNLLSTSDTSRALPSGGWQRLTGFHAAPVGTRYVQVRLLAWLGLDGNWAYVDSVRLERVGGLVEPWATIRTDQLNDLENGWTPWDVSAWPLGYYKNSDNEVSMRGLVRPGTVGYVTVYRMPAGYRPSSPRVLPLPTSHGMGMGQLNPDGTLQVYAVPQGTAWVSLDGVRYRTEQ
ncbi:fibronectin type III domain-containing protein [Myxococcus sp. K38C18041901]|uniref:fibronectin type III domain-containing protein n=1 Tax=Myxococcus guangdongensis TaxID=2906760 RepID=UPI0020A82EA6|nr:fibronectin type III domain-containing protein [Myxococcus guangdongensis]MCP3060977.1 fibronectin type III domain-containing protein [Myxococcus guangdongensis]